jgi:hypothetical protein
MGVQNVGARWATTQRAERRVNRSFPGHPRCQTASGQVDKWTSGQVDNWASGHAAVHGGYEGLVAPRDPRKAHRTPWACNVYYVSSPTHAALFDYPQYFPCNTR